MRTLLATILLITLATLLSAAEAVQNTLSPEESKDGFTLLFNGKNLDGWHGDVKKYPVADGAITCKGANIYTDKQYDNFVFRFQFKLTPAGNNGVGLRTPDKGRASAQGMEIQILDDRDKKYEGKIQPYQVHGSIYGVLPAKRDALKPIGEWNEEEIIADGSRIKVTVNGQVVLDADISKIKETPDHRNHPGLHNAKGHIALLGHRHPIQFRNLRIKELKNSAATQ